MLDFISPETLTAAAVFVGVFMRDLVHFALSTLGMDVRNGVRKK